MRDADLQANTDRYVRLALAKAPEMFRGQPRFLLRRLTFYFARIWIQVGGVPLAVPVAGVEEAEHGFRPRLGRHLPAAPKGPACLTFHLHPATFTRQENHTFVGELSNTGPDEAVFRVHRLLADVSLAGNRLVNTLNFLGKGHRLAPRLEPEASRRGQPVPKVRHPRDHAV